MVGRIHELAEQLTGVYAFYTQDRNAFVALRQGVSEEQYLQGRLRSAKKLARYIVTSSLRSSRAALAEHLVGSKRTIADFEIKKFRKSNPTGDLLGQSSIK